MRKKKFLQLFGLLFLAGVLVFGFMLGSDSVGESPVERSEKPADQYVPVIISSGEDPITISHVSTGLNNWVLQLIDGPERVELELRDGTLDVKGSPEDLARAIWCYFQVYDWNTYPDKNYLSSCSVTFSKGFAGN